MGFEVSAELPKGQAFLRELADACPDVVVIDLSRLPSQGRDMGVLIRNRKATRHIPLVFVGGDPQKVVRIKELLPDAMYTSWGEVGVALQDAIAHPPEAPVVPGSSFAAYAGKPLLDKLGVKVGTTVSLVDAPAGFEETLGKLPDGARVVREYYGESDLVVWFVRSQDILENNISVTVAGLGRGRIWIAWPKQKSGVETDLTQQQVREAGLAAGLVDYKICSVDQVWSALLFTCRRSGE
jgi:hypothetical protein